MNRVRGAFRTRESREYLDRNMGARQDLSYQLQRLERKECGHTYLKVRGGYSEVEKKGGFPVDYACNKRSTICPR